MCVRERGRKKLGGRIFLRERKPQEPTAALEQAKTTRTPSVKIDGSCGLGVDFLRVDYSDKDENLEGTRKGAPRNGEGSGGKKGNVGGERADGLREKHDLVAGGQC